MKNTFELWLDESGSFEQAEQREFGKHPSLVGGILIKKELFTNRDITGWVGQSLLSQRSHGNTMSREERHLVMVPALQSIVERGGHLVYFENCERVDNLINSEL